jgi:hypothetical protein
MRPLNILLVLAALGSLLTPSLAQARARRACTDAACVDVIPSATDPVHPAVRITNRGTAVLAPSDYSFAVECAAGVYETHSVSLAVNVPPGSNVVLYPSRPVCTGHSGPYVGLHVLNMPGTTVYVGALATRAAVETVVAGAGGSSCLGFPSLDLGGTSCGSCGGLGGGGDGGGIIMAAILVVLGVAALGALVLVGGGLCGVGLGWGVPKLIQHKPLDWWVSFLLMEIPLGISVLAGVAASILGGLGAYAVYTRTGNAEDPTLAAGVLGLGVVSAVVLMVLGGLVGTALVVTSSLLFTGPQPKTVEELGDGLHVEAVEVDPGDGAP